MLTKTQTQTRDNQSVAANSTTLVTTKNQQSNYPALKSPLSIKRTTEMQNTPRPVSTTRSLNNFLCTLNFDRPPKSPRSVVTSTTDMPNKTACHARDTTSLDVDIHIPRTDPTPASMVRTVVTNTETLPKVQIPQTQCADTHLKGSAPSFCESDELPDLVIPQDRSVVMPKNHHHKSQYCEHDKPIQ